MKFGVLLYLVEVVESDKKRRILTGFPHFLNEQIKHYFVGGF
jgi:hypothetical protein